MDQKQKEQKPTPPSALQVVTEYTAAMAARDSARMASLRAEGFELDFVHTDASQAKPLSAEEARMFWSFWFVAFPDLDWEVTRIIAAESVVVIQWVFTGTNSGPLDPSIMEHVEEPTGKTIQMRGASFYDISKGLIQRETSYLDMATLMVELGVEL